MKILAAGTKGTLFCIKAGSSSVLEHCSKILSEKTDVESEPYLDGLSEWMQDLNWPGTLTIVYRLKAF